MVSKNTRVLLCGTHPAQYNGYSKVVYEIAKHFSDKRIDFELSIFGFQNFYDNNDHSLERKLPDKVKIYDASKLEMEKNEGKERGKGFGEKILGECIDDAKPDIIILYNDLLITNILLDSIESYVGKTYGTGASKPFKIVSYLDIVYKNHTNILVKKVNDRCDAIIAFSNYWKNIMKEAGVTKPIYVLPHGFNSKTFFPVPKKVCREYFGIKENDFVIMNLNRNQPRKRWDITIKAFVKFLSDHVGEKVRLLVATTVTGAFNIMDIFESECRKFDIPFEQAKQHLIVVDSPQQLTDTDINVMYNLADIGINTCDGEGFGLCNFEQMAIGVPQIVPHVGGFRNIFRNSMSILVNPKVSVYVDKAHGSMGGEAELCDATDFADAISMYYNDPDLVKKHGISGRKHILTEFGWENIEQVFYDILKEIAITLIPIDIASVPVQTGGKNQRSKKKSITLTDEDVDVDDVDDVDDVIGKIEAHSAQVSMDLNLHRESVPNEDRKEVKFDMPALNFVDTKKQQQLQQQSEKTEPAKEHLKVQTMNRKDISNFLLAKHSTITALPAATIPKPTPVTVVTSDIEPQAPIITSEPKSKANDNSNAKQPEKNSGELENIKLMLSQLTKMMEKYES